MTLRHNAYLLYSISLQYHITIFLPLQTEEEFYILRKETIKEDPDSVQA